MENTTSLIDKYYSSEYILDTLKEKFKAAGKDFSKLTVDDLAPVDAFHTRGRAATLEAAALANIQSADRILDVGCGLGGTARFLANRYGCNVVGIDCTRQYIVTGKRVVGSDHAFEIKSLGADGKEGGKGEDADISSKNR